MLFQPLLNLGQLQVHDLENLIPCECPEDNHLVHAVEELGAKGPPQLTHHLLSHALVVRLCAPFLITTDREPQGRVTINQLRSQIRGHYDNGVAEINLMAFGIGEMAILHDLQQHVENFRMGLLDLIEQDNGIRTFAQRSGELPLLLIADVAWRRSDQARHIVSLHELRHVQLDQRTLAAKHEFGQSLSTESLAHARWPQEDKGSDGTPGVFETCPCPPQGFGESTDCLLLSHHPLVQHFFHMEQLLRFLAGDAGHRDAGPHSHHLGDVVGGDGQMSLIVLPFQPQLVDLGSQPLLGIAQIGGHGKVPTLEGLFTLLTQRTKIGEGLFQIRVGWSFVHAHPRSSLINDVNGLIGQVAISHISSRQPGRALHGLISYDHLMVFLVELLYAV